MTAFDRRIEGSEHRGPGRFATALAPLRSFVARVRGAEVLTVGEGRRFLAVQRRRVRTASRSGFLVVAAAVGFDAVALIGLDADGTRVATALDFVVMLVALAGWWLLPRSLRHHPEAVAWVVMTGLVASTVVSGLAVPRLAVQTVAYLLVLPGLMALVLPWRTAVHLRWLLAFAILSVTYLAVGAGRFSADERGTLAVVLFISVGGSLAGHLLLQRIQVRSFAQLESIRGLGRLAHADMIELERVHHALELTARIDPLTGAGNRRRLDEDLRAVRAHIGRSGMTYGLLEIDLDHFKGINDALGHLAGDDVLRRVVEALSGTLRASDAIYRYGGEEFVAILLVPNPDGLVVAAERLRSVVVALGIPHPGNPGVDVVSVSIGATLLGPFNANLSDEGWFAVTDQALYQAKADGRNLVRFAAGPAAGPALADPA
jgi:diguanylate cyclase (GGDEF)-like protein